MILKSVIVVMLTVGILCGCAPRPAREAVTSKSDSVFDISILESATAPGNDAKHEAKSDDVGLNSEPPAGETTWFQWQSQFKSTDGSVEFNLDFSKEIPNTAMPVVEVKPHFFTSEDAIQIAQALFGDQKFYEAAPSLANPKDIFSKKDIQQAIQRWGFYTNEQNLLELFPSMTERSDRKTLYLNRIKEEIANLTLLLEEAPENGPYSLAEWQFKPEWKYTYSESSIPEGIQLDSNGNQKICVTTTINDIPYRLNITTHNTTAYKLNTIFAYPGTVYSPVDIDRDIFRAKLCRTAEPTAQQIEDIKHKAEKMLNEMGIGTWAVDQYYIKNTNPDGTPEYVVSIYAVPVFEGVPAMYRMQLDNLSENYTASYYMSEAILELSANGDLIYLQLSSPVDVTNVISENVAIMDLATLMDRVENHLSLSDYHNYGLSGELLELYEESVGEKLVCNIELSTLNYGLIRVKASESDACYYYVPGIILSGIAEYCGEKSGTVYYSSADYISGMKETPLIALNAIDGSIIDLNQG